MRTRFVMRTCATQREISGEAVFLADEQPVELPMLSRKTITSGAGPSITEWRRHDALSRVGHAAATGRVQVLNDRHTREEAHQREATWLGISVDIGRPRLLQVCGNVWKML
ncbi:hypothetical protein [Paraburkholderia youngii]|uniref:Uncharacterized protein n=1 Tax=Paraburkholderia youngii TaxID=2782701 RepID=A0A7W8LAI9_9BURK|nr:hypothetical protein [Paraburkholderia youngii]MBB5403431.1 hypothetical protein [Paraburkholderia youngii]